MTTKQAADRIDALRSLASGERVHGYWVPSKDEHLGEFIPPWAERRRWISGFTGSAGDLIVTSNKAWLFTDGRYRIQALEQVRKHGITVHSSGRDPSLTQTVTELARRRRGFRLGFDPFTLPASTAESVSDALRKAGGALVGVEPNLVDTLWGDRPSAPDTPLRMVPPILSGRSCSEKLASLRAELGELGADAWVTVKLDEIAWLTNLRAHDDIPYSTAFIAFLYVGPRDAHLFPCGGPRRVPASALPEGVHVHDYHEFRGFLSGLREMRIALDSEGVPAGVLDRLRHAETKLVIARSPVEKEKALKNPAECEAMREANLRASVAKTRALLWLRGCVAAGKVTTEAEFAKTADAFYAEQRDYHGLSFATIVASGTNSALPHYGAVDDTPIEPGTLFLVDSGAHIGGGTTDATRTIAIGPVDDKARRIYTRVLQAHIRLAQQHFPEGTPGTALDTVARSVLWRDRLDYEHGTGHGVGAGLNVHEGPFTLAEGARKPSAIYPLREGMVTSVEPGYYEEGWGGVRLENLYIIFRDDDSGWLTLECLTWIPFDRTLIDRELLSRDEIAWLEEYQEACVTRLAPWIDDRERSRLSDWIVG
ncbi:MAG: Xaa-Pro aminopeptidase [Gemmatimonadetes bacterium]|nr:Xaa-Pro aminopeptidase [Gemmatimonadota bacterium]